MKWRFIAVLAIYLFVGVSGVAQEKLQTDDQLVQGRWDWDPAAKQSDAQPQILLERVVITGDRLTFHYRFNNKRFTSATRFKLNPT